MDLKLLAKVDSKSVFQLTDVVYIPWNGGLIHVDQNSNFGYTLSPPQDVLDEQAKQAKGGVDATANANLTLRSSDRYDKLKLKVTPSPSDEFSISLWNDQIISGAVTLDDVENSFVVNPTSSPSDAVNINAIYIKDIELAANRPATPIIVPLTQPIPLNPPPPVPLSPPPPPRPNTQSAPPPPPRPAAQGAAPVVRPLEPGDVVKINGPIPYRDEALAWLSDFVPQPASTRPTTLVARPSDGSGGVTFDVVLQTP